MIELLKPRTKPRSMVFTSWKFVVFFAVVLLAVWLCRSRRARQLTILASSLVFYMSWRPGYVILLAAPSVIDYWCALRIAQTGARKERQLYLAFSVVSNIALLAYFKYATFLSDALLSPLGLRHPHFDIILPVGISFFTFKALSYTIDVYRGEIGVCRDWLKYVMFITYFPELVAGPIVRASIFLPQLSRSLKLSVERVQLGLQIILVGVTKKLLIADRLAPYADAVFTDPAKFSPISVVIGVLSYAVQIYCDFSGYSDIAIGTSKIIGLDLPENFNMPYISGSLTEFWRRWHMTLSSWLRDYLYIPLGGNRHGRLRTYVNLFLTMLLGGLWHGASWTFVVWGLIHGAGLAVERMLQVHGPTSGGGISRVFGQVRTLFFVCLAWIFFRSPDFSTAMIILRKVFWMDRSGAVYYYLPFFLILPVMVLGHGLGLLAARQARGSRRISPPAWLKSLYPAVRPRFAIRPHRSGGIYVMLPSNSFATSFAVASWILLIFFFSPLTATPFIYFQF